MIESMRRRSRGLLAKLPGAMVWSLLLVFGSHGMAQQPDFRDGLYGPDDGPFEILTTPTMSIPNLFFPGRSIVIKVSWPRDLPATLTFPGPDPVGEVCDPPPPAPPPPLIGLPPPPRPTEPNCHPDPNYQPYPGGPNNGMVPPPDAVRANPSYPYPLIVWSHGPNEDFRNYYHLVRHLVSHGYAVVQVQHYDAKELAATPIEDVVNQSITNAYAALHPQPQAADFNTTVGSGPVVVQLSGGPCYYRWVGSNATLIHTLEGLGLEQPYLGFLGLVVKPFFEDVVDSVGALIGASGLRLDYGCFEANTPNSTIQIPNASYPVTWHLDLPTALFDIPGWYFIPALGGSDPTTPAGQYNQTSAQDGGPITSLHCEEVLQPPAPPPTTPPTTPPTPTPKRQNPVAYQQGGGNTRNQPLRRLICTTRSATTVQVRNNTTRYTRWLRHRSGDFMGLLQAYLSALQAWQDGLQVCINNASIMDRQNELISVLMQITHSQFSDQGFPAEISPMFVDEMIDQQRGIQGRYTFAPGTPEQVIMDNHGACPEPENQGEQGNQAGGGQDNQGGQTVSYCVLRDDVLQGKIDIQHVGLGGYAQGAAAVVDMVTNPPADAIWSPAFREECSFYEAYSAQPFQKGAMQKTHARLGALQAAPPPQEPPPEQPPQEPTGFSIMPINGYFLLDPQYSNIVYADDYSWTFFSRPMMEVLSPGGNANPFQNSPLGDKYLATIPGTDDYFGGIRRRPEDECPPGDTSYPCTRDEGFYNELTNPKIADYVQSLALAFFDAHVHYDEQNRRRPARTFLKSNQVMEATGQEVQYHYK